ncbi:MAG: HDOD domain-containing protein [Planctomycetales bacterium]|nr:HDOD domain-containing protein [Planctomycetales bacterium]
MKRVLFVDDEVNVLSGLRRMLRGLRDQWHMEFASSGVEALELFAKAPFDVVVSDMRMPGMDGAQLLQEVRNRYPNTVRIVLSGQSEQERVLRAVGPAHQFLSKPCEAETIKSTIRRASALRDELNSAELAGIVGRLESLPSLPQIYVDLVELVDSDGASTGSVGELISSDPAMAAKVLQLVNSSFFSLPHRVVDPSHAVTLLGMERIRALVLSASVFQQFEAGPFAPEVLEGLINHSLAVATTARRIALQCGGDTGLVENAFTGGLLHDVGKIVVLSQLPDIWKKLIDASREQHTPFWQIERHTYGCTHAVLGAHLLSLWGLPDCLVEAVAWHHEPDCSADKNFSPLTAVHVANVLQSHFAPCDGEIDDTPLCVEYLERLNLPTELAAWDARPSAAAS